MQQKNESSLRELDIGYYVNRYVSLFWRWKIWILLASPVVTAGWVVYILKFGSIKPDLESTATIVIENAKGEVESRYEMESDQDGIEFIRSRNFLSSIVNQLSLGFSISDHGRYEVLDSVYVDTSALPGQYIFKIDKEMKNYQLFLTNREFKNKLIESGDLFKLDKIIYNGVYLQFSEEFLKDPFMFNFNVSSMRSTVDRLLKTISVQNKILERNGPMYVNVSSKGKDYRVITQTVNTIVEKFISMSQGVKKQKLKENIAVLEKQLQTVTEQLNDAQNSVEKFRKQYPNVGLGAELMSNLSTLSALEAGSIHNSSWAQEAQRIQSRLALATDNDVSLYVKEALAFLANRGVTAAPVLQQEFVQLDARQQQLLTEYDKNHPYFQEISTRIMDFRLKADVLLSEYAKNTSQASLKQSRQVQGLTDQLRGLPVLQSRLAELERQAQVTSKIHSDILSKYNQAKIADAVKIDGINVIDYAVEPIPPSDFVNMLIKLGIGLLIALSVSFGPPVLADMLDKTVRSEKDLLKMLDITILESIPEIKKNGTTEKTLKEEKKKTSKAGAGLPQIRTIDEKLITADYSPDFTNELFRSLRAKIMLRMYEVEKKTILVSSHGVSEGKSLISSNLAITMAQQQLKTVLIDGDIRRGVLHNSFVLLKKPGLSNFLFSESPVTIESTKELLQSTHVPNLSLISSGVNVPNPSELLGLARFKTLLECLNQLFDVIIFDTPPLCVAADAAIAGSFFSACVIVVRAGVTNVIDLRKRLQEFPNFKKKLIGVVLNGTILDRKMKEYQYSMYHY